jgi:hypothetical protein
MKFVLFCLPFFQSSIWIWNKSLRIHNTVKKSIKKKPSKKYCASQIAKDGKAQVNCTVPKQQV